MSFNVRVVDEAGNKQDFETNHVPRIGERIVLAFGVGGQQVRRHHFRVKDVKYHLDQKPDSQAAIWIEEEAGAIELWPDEK